MVTSSLLYLRPQLDPAALDPAALVNGIFERGELADYHLAHAAHAARADLCRRLNRRDEARRRAGGRLGWRSRRPNGVSSNGGWLNYSMELCSFLQ